MSLLSGLDPSNIGPNEISRIARAWIERYEKKLLITYPYIDAPDEDTTWASFAMIELVNYFPEKAFLAIDEVLLQTDHEFVLCNLAAGPLEDLIRNYGETVLPQIECRAKNEKFRDLFSWMYQVVPDELWGRIMALVGLERQDDE